MILTVTPNPCVDKTVFLDRLAPGEKNRGRACTCVPGGKGTNVARAVGTIGHAVRPLVIVGGRTGDHVLDMIREQDGLDPIPVRVASPTRTVTTILEEPIHRQTPVFEPGSRVTPEEYAAAVETFKEHVSDARLVAFCGTVCDPAIDMIYRDLIPIACEAGAITILDAHGPEFAKGLEARPYLVKPNADEAAELLGYALDGLEAQRRAVADLHGRGVEAVALSLGAGGALISRGDEILRATPPTIKEVNPVGSGDAFVAGLAIGLLQERSLAETARLATAMGTANAMSWDIGHFTPEQVEELAARVEIRSD